MSSQTGLIRRFETSFLHFVTVPGEIITIKFENHHYDFEISLRCFQKIIAMIWVKKADFAISTGQKRRFSTVFHQFSQKYVLAGRPLF
jgi:hypothetical protein